MKIAFLMLHPGFVRNYEPVLRQLARRGHQVHVAFEIDRNKLGKDTLIGELSSLTPPVTFGDTPAFPPSPLVNFARVIRILQDYVRYLGPEYERAVSLRQRVEEKIPAPFRRVMRLAGGGTRAGRAALAAVFRAMESALTPPAVVEAFLREQAPDVVLVTPLVDFGSDQVDYIKASRERRIPSALCVASWDNLTNKGLMRVIPDRVLVWNEGQKQEAVALHGAPADRVVITGAQLFDHWFDWTPSRSREEFCARVGLDPARPYVLYLGSSYFIAPDEAANTEPWIRAVRASRDPLLARAGILIRPHPTNLQQWLATDFSRLDNVALWPRTTTSHFAEEFKGDFYDSMFHSAAIAGVNTSALIEAAIVGRAVCTYLAPEFAHSQRGTLHFQHLVGANGGCVQAAETLDEHLAQLAAAVRGDVDVTARSRRFVEAFVRPHGLERPATPYVVDAIEALGRLAPAPSARPAWAGTLRALLAPLAWLVGTVWEPGRKLTETRTVPLWAYALRPFIFVAVMALRVRIGVADALDGAGDGVRRNRRLAQRQAYAARQWVRRTMRPQEWPAAVRRTARQSSRRVRSSWRRAIGIARSGLRVVWR